MKLLPSKPARWLAEPLKPDVARSIERLAAADDVVHIALMPDIHLAGAVCIGTAVATSNLIYPSAVGGDIGCGMATICFEESSELLANEYRAAQLLADLYQRVPTNRHPAGTLPEQLPEDTEQSTLSDRRLDKLKRRDGLVQLGTLGRGNHFLEFQAGQDNRLWLMVHSGSRAMGQVISEHHLQQAQTAGGGLGWLRADTDAGRAYVSDVDWAISYARHNRIAMISAVSRLMRELFGTATVESSLIHTDHNHVRREKHFGSPLWVHRKGAQSARTDEPGIIPGSMATASFHVAGRGCAEALTSSSHGAGRKLTRTEAKRSIGLRQLYRQMQAVWFDHRRANALRDESPTAYKDIHAVMRAQKNLTRIVRESRPMLSYKGVMSDLGLAKLGRCILCSLKMR